MHPLNNGSQVTEMPNAQNPLGDAGYFTESGAGGKPSYPGAHYFNAQIKEFITVLAKAGVEFDPTKFDHLARVFSAPMDNLLNSLTGMVIPFHTELAIPGWVDAKGGELSRTTDAKLWAHAQAGGLVIAQAAKDAEPKKYAMYFGDGDGANTFTLPNHHLGHFTRGNPAGVEFGLTQEDARRNITGSIYAPNSEGLVPPNNPTVEGAFKLSEQGPSSVFGTQGNTVFKRLDFDASWSVPTANENRPYTANLCIKVFRGFIS